MCWHQQNSDFHQPQLMGILAPRSPAERRNTSIDTYAASTCSSIFIIEPTELYVLVKKEFFFCIFNTVNINFNCKKLAGKRFTFSLSQMCEKIWRPKGFFLQNAVIWNFKVTVFKTWGDSKLEGLLFGKRRFYFF